MKRPPPKPRAHRRTQTEHKPDATHDAANDTKPLETPAETVDLGHALFGHAPVVVVAVEQMRYRGRVLVAVERGRFSPRDIVDGTSLREVVGVGRFKLKPLGSNGRPCLPAIEVDCPDENGGLDLTAPMPDEVSAPSSAPVQGASSLDGVIAALREQISTQRATLTDELKRAEDRRQADMSSMAQFNAQLIDLVKLSRADDGGGSKATLEWVRETNIRLEKENRDLRAELATLKESHLRLRIGHETSGDAFLKAAVETYGPKVLELGAKFMSERRAGGAPAPAASTGAPAPAPDLPDVKLPTAEELRAQLSSGGQVPGEVLQVFRKLREAKALGDEMWSIVGPLISIATGSV